jgi:hypothetical protein
MTNPNKQVASSDAMLAYRVNDFCRVFGLGRTSVYGLIKTGKLPTVVIFRSPADTESQRRETAPSGRAAIMPRGLSIDKITVPRRNGEACLQAEIVAWLRTALPNSLAFAPWTGGDLISKARASKRRWMGVLAGVSDLIVVAPGRVLFLELKSPRCALSTQKQWFRQQVQTLGHACGCSAIGRGF